MIGNVFTILFHGTGEHRDKGHENEEVLHEITKLLIGEEYTDWLVCDGPGASPPAGQTHHPLPGSFDIADKNKSIKQQGFWTRYDTLIKDYNHYLPDNRGEYRKRQYAAVPLWLRGLLMGEGMDDNIRHAIVVLCARFETGNFTVNLLGWSRGGVSCIRAANWFYEIFRERITVNIFAFDPVPGADLGRQIHDTHTLSVCVKSYLSVLCLHDQRTTFEPVDRHMLTLPDLNAVPQVALIPMPGFHATPLYFAPREARTHACPEVARYLAWKYLSLKGTPLRDDALNAPARYTPEHLCDRYAAMMLHLSDYGIMDWSTWCYQHGESPLGLAHRDVLTHRHEYVRRGHESHFLNEHHVTCFRVAYPTLARHLGVEMPAEWPTLTPAPAPPRLARAAGTVIDLRRELTRLRSHGDSYQLLWSRCGLKQRPGDDWLPPPNALACRGARAQLTPRMSSAQAKGYGLLSALMEG